MIGMQLAEQKKKDLWLLNAPFFKNFILIFLVENILYIIWRVLHLNFSQSLVNGGEISRANAQKIQLFNQVENGMEWVLCLTVLVFAERSARRFGLNQSIKWLIASFVGFFFLRLSIEQIGLSFSFYGPNYTGQLLRPMSWILGLVLLEGILLLLHHFFPSFTARFVSR